MGKINELLITEAENYILSIMAEKLSEKIIFHNFNHAQLVKKYAEIIGDYAGFTTDEMNTLKICSLFHDVGYVNSYHTNKEESVKIAESFLSENGIDKETSEYISATIRSTQTPQQPTDKVAEVLCDADMMYIATESAIEQFDLLIEETALQQPDMARRQVHEKKCLEFLANHTYFTEYGKTILQPLKESASKRLSERMKRRKMLEIKKETTEKKSVNYSRGVETLFRLTARNQINLNSIADNKSNILISVNAIIISIIITMLAGNIGNMASDILPILVFLVICLITIIIAILSTRPNIVKTKFTEEDLRNNNVDLIFFGNFIDMEYEEYHKALKNMFKDDEHLYSTMIKNQYSLGKILAKKFRLVKIAYNVFMIGIIITVIVFLANLVFMNATA